MATPHYPDVPFYQLPSWAGLLRNLYWQLRYRSHCRETRRSQIYRKITRERRRLVATGVNPESVRLMCRFLVNGRNLKLLARYIHHVRVMQERQFNLVACHQNPGGMGAGAPHIDQRQVQTKRDLRVVYG